MCFIWIALNQMGYKCSNPIVMRLFVIMDASYIEFLKSYLNNKNEGEYVTIKSSKRRIKIL